MRLILTFLSLLGAAALIVRLMEDGGPWRPRYGIAAAAGVAVVVAMALVGGNLWNSTKVLRDRAKSTAGLDAAAAGVAGGASIGLNLQFLDWTRQRIEDDQTFYLFPSGPATDAGTYQWSTYQLAPRQSVDKPDDADWLVFYNVEPGAMEYDRGRFHPPLRYAPNFYLAQRRAG